MKQVLNTIFSFLRKFFLSIRIHLHVGICSEEDSKAKEEEDADK
jgi:hypothetical protein